MKKQVEQFAPDTEDTGASMVAGNISKTPEDNENFNNPKNQETMKKSINSETSSTEIINAKEVLQRSGYLDGSGNITEKMADLISQAQGNLSLVLTPRYSYKELVGAGYKFSFIDENREVYTRHVDKLYTDVKDSKKQRFDEAGKVIPARRALGEGLKVYDFEGNEITLETENLDLYLVIIDGQHRGTVCREHPDIDLLIEFDEYEGSTLKRIAVLNNKRKDHTGQDQKKSISKQHPGKVNLLDGIEEFRSEFGVTPKYAEAALSGKVDQFKPDELTRIQTGEKMPDQKYQGDPELIKQGFELGCALMYNFGADKEMLKKVKKFELPLMCHRVIEGLQEDEQAGALHKMAIYLSQLDEGQKEYLVGKIGTDSLQSCINKGFVKFKKDHDKADWDALEIEFQTVIDKFSEASSTSATKTVKKLFSGRPWEIVANQKEIAEAEKEKVDKKASGKSKKAATKKAKSTKKSATKKPKSKKKAA